MQTFLPPATARKPIREQSFQKPGDRPSIDDLLEADATLREQSSNSDLRPDVEKE